ncbi:UDP-N-acetylglucosamine transporter TMEM241 isoform 3-T3 [Anomaloglossus baeobatrachus]|uniref:UDP-N-acetylglucosamine transporter TMEM241 isoform X3 n=1 Tax=Anomaloglossus baeobatrachus TaxID=238106 RepID=UPI003F50A5A3
MYFRGPAVGLSYCSFYLAFYFTNKYVLSILKFTYPTLFQGWQTLVGGVFLHIWWKLGWVEINCSSRADIVSWLPASAFFVGIIYAGSRALSRLPIPIFLTLHNGSEVVAYVVQRIFFREQSSCTRLCSVTLLLVSAASLPIHDQQFDVDGYFWAIIHLVCSGCYKIFQKSHKSSLLSDLDQQYINYFFSVLLLAFASHPTGDLISALEFPFLYIHTFHGGCCASGIFGFLLTLLSVKLRSSLSSTHHLSWSFFAKFPDMRSRRGSPCVYREDRCMRGYSQSHFLQILHFP